MVWALQKWLSLRPRVPHDSYGVKFADTGDFRSRSRFKRRIEAEGEGGDMKAVGKPSKIVQSWRLLRQQTPSSK
jgi:hypothetical protein